MCSSDLEDSDVCSSIFFDIRVGDILSVMFGGKQIRVSISIGSAVWTMAAMLLAGLAANWYPVRLALKISPLEAINR